MIVRKIISFGENYVSPNVASENSTNMKIYRIVADNSYGGVIKDTQTKDYISFDDTFSLFNEKGSKYKADLFTHNRNTPPYNFIESSIVVLTYNIFEKKIQQKKFQIRKFNNKISDYTHLVDAYIESLEKSDQYDTAFVIFTGNDIPFHSYIQNGTPTEYNSYKFFERYKSDFPLEYVEAVASQNEDTDITHPKLNVGYIGVLRLKNQELVAESINITESKKIDPFSKLEEDLKYRLDNLNILDLSFTHWETIGFVGYNRFIFEDNNTYKINGSNDVFWINSNATKVQLSDYNIKSGDNIMFSVMAKSSKELFDEDGVARLNIRWVDDSGKMTNEYITTGDVYDEWIPLTIRLKVPDGVTGMFVIGSKYYDGFVSEQNGSCEFKNFMMAFTSESFEQVETYPTERDLYQQKLASDIGFKGFEFIGDNSLSSGLNKNSYIDIEPKDGSLLMVMSPRNKIQLYKDILEEEY